MAAPRAAAESAGVRQLRAELREALEDTEVRADAEYHEVLRLLGGFAEQVSEFLNAPDRTKANVSLEVGHVVELGQEYRVVVAGPEIGLKDYLLRAYVPADGYPVTLEYLAEEEKRCDNEEQLVAALVAAIRHEHMRSRLLALRQALSDETLRGGRRTITSGAPQSAPVGAARGVRSVGPQTVVKTPKSRTVSTPEKFGGPKGRRG
jgi:hypothetical protein